MDGVRRPNPLRWVAYAFGARLPARTREWVLFDATTRTWVLRHLVRTVVQLGPFVVALYVLIPGEPWVRGCAVLAGVILGFFYSSAYMHQTAELHVMKAGYPRGTAEATRTAARPDVERARQERYAQRWRTGS